VSGFLAIEEKDKQHLNCDNGFAVAGGYEQLYRDDADRLAAAWGIPGAGRVA
jgi:hypothetical protein